METRANYVLIGLFALAGFAGIIGFVLWFANIQLDRRFAYYDVDFPSVSGLAAASDVRFAGLPVGQVVRVRLSTDRPGRVEVRLEVDAATPVRTDSEATVESQGVTGVSFVAISAGTPDAPLLAEASDAKIPTIRAGRSLLQSLSEGAPEIAAETLGAVRDLRALIGDENQERVAAILTNVEQASVAFTAALDDFAEVSGSVSDFATEIDRFNALVEGLSQEASGTLQTAQDTLAAIEKVSTEARDLVAAGTATLTAAETYLEGTLTPVTRDVGASSGAIEARIVALGDTLDGLAATYARTGEAATARLDEIAATITAADAMIAGIDTAARNVDTAALDFDALIEESAAPLIAELRAATAEADSALSLIGTRAREDLPAILADIRTATATAARVIDTVGADLTAASGRADALAQSGIETLETVRTTFADANATLGALNTTLASGDRALIAAERAFAGADRVLTEDIEAIVAGLNEALAGLDTAIAAIAADIPVVTQDLRAASDAAQSAFTELEGVIGTAAPPFRDFATGALPQYTRLGAETRALIENLNALTEQIRRDPGRFLLNPRTPEYRR